MNYYDINKKIKELNTEEFIWIIYIGIIIFSFVANYFEKKYFLSNNTDSKEKYRKIMILIFSILLLIYIYFLKSSIDSIRSIKPSDSSKKKMLVYMSFIASLLISISGFIFLFIAIYDDTLEVELAFN